MPLLMALDIAQGRPTLLVLAVLLLLILALIEGPRCLAILRGLRVFPGPWHMQLGDDGALILSSLVVGVTAGRVCLSVRPDAKLRRHAGSLQTQKWKLACWVDFYGVHGELVGRTLLWIDTGHLQRTVRGEAVFSGVPYRCHLSLQPVASTPEPLVLANGTAVAFRAPDASRMWNRVAFRDEAEHNAVYPMTDLLIHDAAIDPTIKLRSDDLGTLTLSELSAEDKQLLMLHLYPHAGKGIEDVLALVEKPIEFSATYNSYMH